MNMCQRTSEGANSNPLISRGANSKRTDVGVNRNTANAKRIGLVLTLAFLLLGFGAKGWAQGIPLLSEAVIDYNTSGDHTLISGVSGQRIRVYRVYIACMAANNVILKDSTPTTLQPVISQAFILDVSPIPWFTAALGTSFVVNLSASQQCSGRIYYTVS